MHAAPDRPGTAGRRIARWDSSGVPRFIAAGELGSGVFFNPVAPEDAAQALRDA
jgi:UDPglucose--hexose-1-phosphate uridylyltransferase